MKWILSFAAVFSILAVIFPPTAVCAYEVNNTFTPDGFPGKVSERVFSIRLDPATVLAVCPDSAEPAMKEMQALLKAKCGSDIPFRRAGEVSADELAGRDLIIIGNIADNRWALELYKRRYAFADAYFPGKGGVVITPAQSIWNPDRNVIVIGVSRDEDVKAGFAVFAGLVESGVKSIGPLRHLKTTLAFPKPPESVSSTLDYSKTTLSPSGTTTMAVRSASIEQARKQHQIMAPYSTIANWGLAYHITGDRKWAEHFLEGMKFCYERAEKTGWWIPEPWTNVYFCLWKMVYAWELIDDDPFFTAKDRKLIDEVLWGYTRFCNWLPNLDADLAPPDEPRQNHTTFLGLSLYCAHRYFTTKYGIAGLDSLREKVRAAFDRGAAVSYRPNDDAGGYINIEPMHLLIYQMAEGDMSFLESGKLLTLADLMAACIDNRGDQVGFGDVGGYFHRGKGAARGPENMFFGMAGWHYNDSRFRWLYNWNTSSDKRKRDGDFTFSLEELYSGYYASEGKEQYPSGFTGVHPITLDGGALRWSAMRSWKNTFLPHEGVLYLDKLVMRSGFDPEDEYLLLDGTSTFSHGHYDGNTVTRLAWKDRIWLFETDYIKLTARYHNGVTVTRDGVQEEPAPLTELGYAADLNGFGVSGSTSRDYNGADWTRTVVWKKGGYFLFLDTIRALSEGNYRLDQRWRSHGDVSPSGNALEVRQGDRVFTIRTADSAPRNVEYEPDVFLGSWNYPYGDGRTAVWHAVKNIPLERNGAFTFASLMYAEADSARTSRSLLCSDDGVYVVRDGASREIIGLDPEALAERGIASDCALFVAGGAGVALVNATCFGYGALSLDAPAAVHLSFDGVKRSGVLVVPEGAGGVFRMRGMSVAGAATKREGADTVCELAPGTYRVTVTGGALPDFRALVQEYAGAAREVAQEAGHQPVREFGLIRGAGFAAADSITAFCADGGGIVFGDVRGGLTRFDGSALKPLCRFESGRPVTAVYAADINGDGASEIIAGDEAETLSCFDSGGKRLWNLKLSKYYGPNADVTSITSADIDNSGKLTVLAATNGWKLYAVNPDGTVKWEGFTYYHPQTKVGFLKNDDGTSAIAVGTAYQTPLNVLSPRDGKVLWYVWEEMGSEFLATTQYCGIHLTDMVFLDTDCDGAKEIVFGTKYNTVYAMDAKTGAVKWQANVGDEVTAIRVIGDSAGGEPVLAVATDSGDLFIYDRSGRRLLSTGFGSGITDMQILPAPGKKRTDILLATRDGRVIVCDDAALLVRAASGPLGGSPKGMIIGKKSGEDEVVYTVTDKRIEVLRYRPFYLRKMRTD